MLFLYVAALLFSFSFLGRLNDAGRVFLLLLLFYSVAPLFPFRDFSFFHQMVSYEWRADVFALYAVTLLIFTLLLRMLFPSECDHSSSDFKFSKGLVVMWWVALFAFSVDLSFNWPFFLLPKDQYIQSIPVQTKNLFLFTIPAKEMLVGALLFSPFKSATFRKMTLIFGVVALVISIVIGVRHVALLAFLMIAAPKVKFFSGLLLVAALTLAGELSNGMKIFVHQVASSSNNLDFQYWISYLYDVSQALEPSVEQKAILSNLILVLDDSRLIDFGRFFWDVVAGLPFGPVFVNSLKFDYMSGASLLSNYVQVPEGQGTAYSFQIVMIETFGFVFLVAALMLYLARLVRGTMLYIFSGEIFYSILRNAPDYWLSQSFKLAFLILSAIFLHQILTSHFDSVNGRVV